MTRSWSTADSCTANIPYGIDWGRVTEGWVKEYHRPQKPEAKSCKNCNSKCKGEVKSSCPFWEKVTLKSEPYNFVYGTNHRFVARMDAEGRTWFDTVVRE